MTFCYCSISVIGYEMFVSFNLSLLFPVMSIVYLHHLSPYNVTEKAITPAYLAEYAMEEFR